MASTFLGLVLDSSTAIAAERRKLSVPGFIESILHAHGPLDLSLSPVTVAELVHGIFRAQTPAASQVRRQFVEELVNLVPAAGSSFTAHLKLNPHDKMRRAPDGVFKTRTPLQNETPYPAILIFRSFSISTQIPGSRFS